jgi:glycopeptide antibiotics resistance protein
MRSRHHVVTVVLAGYAALLLVALVAPSSDTQSGMVTWLGGVLNDFGVPGWLTRFQRLEVVMNAVIIAPVTLLGSVLWPAYGWRDWAAYGFVGSVTIETVQLVMLPGRHTSFSDVVANTLGALLGGVLFHLAQALGHVFAPERTHS